MSRQRARSLDAEAMDLRAEVQRLLRRCLADAAVLDENTAALERELLDVKAQIAALELDVRSAGRRDD